MEMPPMTVENFAPSIDRVLAYEGAFTVSKTDPGNWTGGKIGVGKLLGTKYGISAASFPDIDIRSLTQDRAREIYRQVYWSAIRGDELPSGVDLAMVDFAVNSGTARAIMALQRAVGVADDGHLGAVTMAAVQAADPRKVIKAICDDRMYLLRHLKTWPTYGKGWAARVADVRARALAMTAAPPTLLARLFGKTSS